MLRRLSVFALLLLLRGECRKICVRKHHAISNSVFFQRVELPSALKCVERCVENIDFCRSVVFVQDDIKKDSGFCQLHSVNSESGTAAHVHPEANLEPASTVYELLQRCPSSLAPMDASFLSRMKPELRRLLETSDGLQDVEVPRSTRRPTVRTETVGLSVDDGEVPPRKIGVSGSSYISSPDTFSRPGEAVALLTAPENPGAIRPAQVSYGSQFHDLQRRVPCPATQGGPCAPKPRCGDPPLPSCGGGDEFVHEAEVEELSQSAVWSEWVTVSECTVTCGAGALRRQRFCSNDDSSLCAGESQRLEPCDGPPCEGWSSWREWSSCSASCGRGQKIRVRDCRLASGCPGPAEERDECGKEVCPRWAEWASWTKCSRSCGHGVARRTRTCEGERCEGRASEERSCNERSCGEWAPWTEWEQCSRPCGGGKRVRIRTCRNGVDCRGPSEESISCNMDPCPLWTEWTGWSQCTQSCGEDATRLRTRECRKGRSPSAECEGPSQDQGSCSLAPCPVWSEWEEWSACSVSCGNGQQTRNRQCTGGRNCGGGGQEIRFCQETPCPYWGPWTDWGGCSVSCGTGSCERTRKCIYSESGTEDLFPGGDDVEGDTHSDGEDRTQVSDPNSHHAVQLKQYKLEVTQSETRRAPKKPLSPCTGPDLERKECYAGLCCEWTAWEHWAHCHSGCRQGSRRRSRQCVPEGDQLGETPHSVDDHSTGSRGGRTPLYVSDSPAFSLSQPLQPIRPTVSHRGHRKRRQIAHSYGGNYASQYAQAPLIGSAAVCDCPGENEQFEKCLDGVCGSPFAQADEQLCSWSEWADWSPCVGDCPKALRQRTRVCRDGEGLRRRPRFPGFQCQCAGDMRQSESCVPSHCRAAEDRFLVSRGTFDDEDMCQWSVWSEWSRCGADFLKQRTRFCTGQKSLVNNCECIGRAFEQTSCTPRIDAHNFAVNATVLERSRKMLQERLKEKNAASEDSCQWNAWNEWSTCSATCGDGERLRKRLCPCRRCGGISTETEACRLASCYSTSSGDRVRNPFD